jgi:hypothetical protein
MSHSFPNFPNLHDANSPFNWYARIKVRSTDPSKMSSTILNDYKNIPSIMTGIANKSQQHQKHDPRVLALARMTNGEHAKDVVSRRKIVFNSEQISDIRNASAIDMDEDNLSVGVDNVEEANEVVESDDDVKSIPGKLLRQLRADDTPEVKQARRDLTKVNSKIKSLQKERLRTLRSHSVKPTNELQETLNTLDGKLKFTLEEKHVVKKRLNSEVVNMMTQQQVKPTGLKLISPDIDTENTGKKADEEGKESEEKASEAKKDEAKSGVAKTLGAFFNAAAADPPVSAPVRKPKQKADVAPGKPVSAPAAPVPEPKIAYFKSGVGSAWKFEIEGVAASSYKELVKVSEHLHNVERGLAASEHKDLVKIKEIRLAIKTLNKRVAEAKARSPPGSPAIQK